MTIVLRRIVVRMEWLQSNSLSVTDEAVCVTTIKCGDIKVDVRRAQSVALSNYGN